MPTATQETPQQKLNAVREMMVRTVALALTFSGIGNRKKVASNRVEIKEAESQPDPDFISTSKKLLDAPELKAISKLDTQIREYVDAKSVPSMMKRGVYLMKTENVVEVSAKLEEFAVRRRDLVEKLSAALNTRIEESQKRLGDLFCLSEYPTSEYIQATFQLRWQYVSFRTPVSLKQISEDVYEREREKTEKEWAEAREVIQQTLRSGMADMISHLVEKLKPGEDGKAKTFKASSVSKFKDFLATFDERNIANDEELKKIVDQARGVLDGVDAKTLRSEELTREFTRSRFETIKQSLDEMIVKKPTRAITFDEE